MQFFVDESGKMRYSSASNMNTAEEVTTQVDFSGLGIAPSLLDILTKHRFTTPTPIQRQSIPVAITGEDVVGIAQTGTGKTLAFGIPMIQRLATYKGRGLILVPTRELALQVEESLRRIGSEIGMRTAVLIGGASMNVQKDHLRKNPHVIIATPGRLIDHMEQKTVDLSKTTILVLDEADRMLDMGFAPQINRILDNVPSDRQTMLFSATMPTEIVSIAAKQMRKPVRIEVAPAGTANERVTQELFFVAKNDKDRLLKSVLDEIKGSTLVFSRTKHGAKKIAKTLRDAGVSADEIHANRSLAQRKAALEGFKNGKFRVLVATDIAARGIDVKNIELVVNYDLPDNPEDYVHRIGRTGRAGRDGRAISFATPDQRGDVKDIERVLRSSITTSQLPGGLAAPQLGPENGRLPKQRRDQNRGSGGREKRYDAPRAHTPSHGGHSGSRSNGQPARRRFTGRRTPAGR